MFDYENPPLSASDGWESRALLLLKKSGHRACIGAPERNNQEYPPRSIAPETAALYRVSSTFHADGSDHLAEDSAPCLVRYPLVAPHAPTTDSEMSGVRRMAWHAAL